MDKVLIGSKALQHWFPDFNRQPKDIDFAVPVKNIKRVNETEYLYNPIIVDYMYSLDKYANIDFSEVDYLIADKDTLLTLKISHLFWDINWEKHIRDTIFLFSKGAKINKELFGELFVFWESIHGKRKCSDLTLDATKFFDNAINKNGYNHDYLHTLLKEVPTYTKILKDGSEVEPCETKFNNLTFEDKCSVVQEEVMVMAFERYNNMKYRNAYTKMLKKFIINHAPIWESLFIIENILKLERPQFNYFKRLQNENRL
jgi:hypothetical protein